MIARALLIACAACLSWLALAADTDALPSFSADEVRRILQFGPWPVETLPDPSNRVSGKPAAIDLGERLFFDTRLSRKGLYSCRSCHNPERSWTDGDKVGEALAKVDRNTPSLLNQRLHRWYGLDGANDSLWGQSIRPILDERELGSSPRYVANLVREDPDYACRYAKAFGKRPPYSDDEAVLVDVAKSLAAFQETIVSGRTAFDEFRDAVERGDREAQSRYSPAAQRGLKIFIGRGACVTCHFGPNFTNGEFHDIGVPFFLAPGKVDPGRYDGVRKLLESKFNLLGPYNDDAARSTATGTLHVAREQRNFGEFKVPSLRNVALTAPYMHNGRYDSLREVVNHYSELNEDRLHADGERILKPLKLSEREAADLVAFLESLTSQNPEWRAKPPRAGPPCK